MTVVTARKKKQRVPCLCKESPDSARASSRRFLSFLDHSYVRVPLAEQRCASFMRMQPKKVPERDKKKRARSPTGLTPLKNKKTLPSVLNRNKPWTQQETDMLSDLVAETPVHTKAFWQQTARQLSSTFSTFRSDSSCRHQYASLLQGGKVLPVRDGTAHKGCQTEPAIPVNICGTSSCSKRRDEAKEQEKHLSGKQEKDFSEEQEEDLSEEHDGDSSAQKTDHHEAVEILKQHSVQAHQCRDEPVATTTTQAILNVVLNNGTNGALAAAIHSDENLQKVVWNDFCEEISEDAEYICTGNRSILAHKGYPELTNFEWKSIIEEMARHTTKFLEVLLAFVRCSQTAYAKLVPALAFIYSLCMRQRSKDMTLVQRVVSVILENERVPQKVFDRLQPLGVCLSQRRAWCVVDELEKHLQNTLVDSLTAGKRFRLVTDNVNFTVKPSHLRLPAQTEIRNCFGGAAIIQQMSFNHLANDAPQHTLLSLPWEQFLPQAEDWRRLKDDYVVLIMRVLLKHTAAFATLKDCVPDVIAGEHTDALQGKQMVIPLPVLSKDEMKNSDVIEILDFYEEFVRGVHEQAGAEFKDTTTVHIGGDQLTRERFSCAKRERAQQSTAMNQFSHLSPVTFELFHLQMCLLSVIYKRLYNDKSTETGTLGAERTRLGRQRADGNKVHEHFNDCHELLVSVTDAYIVEAACHFFGMQTPQDEPTKHLPPQALGSLSREEKCQWMTQVIVDLIDQFVLEKTVSHLAPEDVHSSSQSSTRQVRVIMPDQSEKIIHLTDDRQQQPTSSLQSHSQDDSTVYAGNVLELGLLYKELQDAISVPDRSRMLSILKYTMLVLKGHSTNSKYALEILRLLMHQEATLTEQVAHESFYGLFVNLKGKKNTHIPADLAMEHVVKVMKSHIKALGAHKTEDIILRRTGAIGGMTAICQHFEQQTGVIVRASGHSAPSAEEDEKLMIQSLRRLKPFENQPGRVISSVPRLSHSIVCKIDKKKLKSWIVGKQLSFSKELGN